MARFPASNAGGEMDRDPIEGVNAVGPQAAISLPLFNRDRSEIAIQCARSAMLRQINQANLDNAQNQADRV
jgi:outer membrane protein, heavy metal efflux system